MMSLLKKSPRCTKERGELAYSGKELEIFAHARNWKAYWASLVLSFIRDPVLEVGAGIDNNTALLLSRCPSVTWTCLEPDSALLACLVRRMAAFDGLSVDAVCGTTSDLVGKDRYAAILYIDVLEHIENDAEELDRAARMLRPNGYLIVLAPAHPWLFSDFDAAIGHYRRYTRRTLLAQSPRNCKVQVARYLDAAGLLASMSNRLFTRQAVPSRAQIWVWDRLLVPFSRVLDRVTMGKIGKSVLVVWRRQ